jgi:hypothetical protein
VAALNLEGNILRENADQQTESQAIENIVESAVTAGDSTPNIFLTHTKIEKTSVQGSALVKSDLGVKPLAESHAIMEQGNIGDSGALSTARVEADATVIYFGDYSFDKQSRAVVRRKSKKTNEMVI